MTHLMQFFFPLILLIGCMNADEQPDNEIPDNEMETILAKITEVTVSGNSGSYTFNVTIESPDTGCDQYADWWEVFNPDGELLYRRILAHSHVDEQPFTRSGGLVPIAENTEVIVRAHMNNLGYGTQVFRGTVSGGFEVDSIGTDFAIQLETTEPLPTDCAF